MVRLTDGCLSFTLDAEEYQPPIWKSYREYLKWELPRPCSRPAWGAIPAADLVQQAAPSHGPEALCFSVREREWSERAGKALSPGQDPQGPLPATHSGILIRKRCLWFRAFFLLCFFFFLHIWSARVNVEFLELCSWPISCGYKILWHLPQTD